MIELPPGPFACIMADPPWQFKTYSNREKGEVPSRAAIAHYEVMALDELKAIPVETVSDANCALFLWVVDSHFDQALELGAAWGFGFKTCAFVWLKSQSIAFHPPLGMGYWTRKQSEQCWLFTRGHPARMAKDVPQALFCTRGPHSAKPVQIYERIERLVDGPRLELFARHRRFGWRSWGNEVDQRQLPLLD